MSAPLRTRNWTQFRWPLQAESCKGVFPICENTSNKKHFKEMNSHARMTIVKKRTGTRWLFQSAKHTSHITSLYTNPLIISSIYVGWECEKYALLMHNTQVGTTHKSAQHISTRYLALCGTFGCTSGQLDLIIFRGWIWTLIGCIGSQGWYDSPEGWSD